MPQNLGNQTVSFAYGQAATSMMFNRINHRLHSTGIYWGGGITINSNTEITIDRFVAYLNDDLSRLGIRIETNETATITLDATTPYIRVRMYWENVRGTTAYIEAVGEAALAETRSVAYIGKAIYEGSTLTGIDYTYQDKIGLDTFADKRTFPFYVAADDPYSGNVIVKGGKVKLYDTTVTLADTTLAVPATTDGRIDIVVLTPDGNISLLQGTDSATPVQPDLDGNIEIAKINRGAGRTTVYGTEITQTLADILIPQLKGLETDDNGDLILTYLSADRLLATDVDKKMVSVDIKDWVAGTTNELVVNDLGNGKVQLRFADNPVISGDTTINKALNVLDEDSTGNTINGDTTLAGSATVTGGTTLNKALNVLDEDSTGTTFSKDVTINGTTTVQGIVAKQDSTVEKNLTIQGNLTVMGSETIVNTVEMTIEDNMLVLNSGEQGDGVSAGTSGIEIYRNTSDNVTFIWDENTDTFRVGSVQKEEGEIQAVSSLTITLESTVTSTDTEYFNGKRVNIRKVDGTFIYGNVATTGANYVPATFELTVQDWVGGTPIAGDFYSITMQSDTKEIARLNDGVPSDSVLTLDPNGALSGAGYTKEDLNFFEKSKFVGIYEPLDFVTPSDTSSSDEIEDLTQTTGDFILRINRNYDTLLEGRDYPIAAGSIAETPLTQDGSNKYFFLTSITYAELDAFVAGDTLLRFRSSYEDYAFSAVPLAHVYITDETLSTATVKKKIVVTADYPSYLPAMTRKYIRDYIGGIIGGDFTFTNTGLELSISGSPELNYLGKQLALPDQTALPLRYMYKDDTDTWQFSDYETFHTELIDRKVVSGVESTLADGDYVMKAIYVAPPIDSQSSAPQYFEVSIDGVYTSDFLFDNYIYSEDRYYLDKQFRDMGFTELGLVIVKKESGVLSVDSVYKLPSHIRTREGVGGAGAGSTLLNELLDISITDPVDEDFLLYNATSQEWENRTLDLKYTSSYTTGEAISFTVI